MESLKEKLENLAKQGLFGEGSFLRVLGTSDSGKGIQLQSELVFLQVDLVPATGKITKVPVVVKTQVTDEKAREENGGHGQFMNEVIMYKNILPQLGALSLDLCPKMFYGEANNGEKPEDDLIVIEDLRPQGYKVSEKLFLDHNHVLLAINKLGKFHGLSYKLKSSSPEKFVELRNMLTPKVFNGSDGQYDACLVRGFKPLVDSSPTYSVVNRVYKRINGLNMVDFLRSLQKPTEPFAVITHGDFNANNFLFKYNNSGDVVDMKFIDFGYSNYLDPVVDIAFFLYLNTSLETRKHWDSFLKSYWDGVISVAENPGFSFRQFHDHFARRAVYGYGPCSFFLPMMHVNRVMDDNWQEMDVEAKKEYLANLGGQECTNALKAIVSDLQHEGYLDAYLSHLDGETTKEATTPGYTNVTFNFA